jgi:hypothetical protein
MAKTDTARRSGASFDVATWKPGAAVIPVFALGLSLGLFFAITYTLCILYYLWFPDQFLNHAVLSLFLPGFKLLSWASFFLGLLESFAYGWYIALVFAPLYNFFAARLG